VFISLNVREKNAISEPASKNDKLKRMINKKTRTLAAAIGIAKKEGEKNAKTEW